MSCIKVISKSDGLEKYTGEFGGKIKINNYKKGELKLGNQGAKWKFHMLSIWFGKHEWETLTLQVTDSIRFLRKYGDVLDRMHADIKDIDMFIDFPVQCRIKNKIAVQQDEIPLQLIKLCAEHKLYINIAIYA